MKQVLQNLKTGETILEEVPSPKVSKKNIIIKSNYSVVSVGTEKMLIDFGKAGYFSKAKQQPEKVKQVIDKIKTDGFFSTYEAIKSKLDQPIPLGYSNAGVVVSSGSENFKEGDRVISNGNHAEFVKVPQNLCAKIPESVDDESAAFTVIGAIALQGVRLLKPTIGETFVVMGLGLIGLISIQLLRANGCNVIGIDRDKNKCKIAQDLGYETFLISDDLNPLQKVKKFTKGNLSDGVLITASSRSNKIIKQSANMCRKRGRIVLVGVVGLEIDRNDFYEKEISFQVSSSYGPGRYDPFYEKEGNDYPLPFVRWTEQRNFEAFLGLLEKKVINLKPLISHVFEIDKAVEAYTQINSKNALGILLKYSDNEIKKNNQTLVKLNNTNFQSEDSLEVGFLGAGNYSSRVLIPVFKKCGVTLNTVSTEFGLSGVHHGKKNGFLYASTSNDDVLGNDKINIIVIATRHNQHSEQVIESLNKNKNVFVEKPLALTIKEIEEIEKSYLLSLEKRYSRLMVGFNRRFAPHILKMKKLLDKRSSVKTIIMTINPGYIPKNHWTQDRKEGGGRIIGEVCHFIDLLRYLVGSKIKRFYAVSIGKESNEDVLEDKVTITLSFEDGSIGTIHYFSNGHSSYPKETIDVFCEHSILNLNNYIDMRGYGWPGFRKMKLFKQDKGQSKCVEAFIDSIKNGTESPIPIEEIIESSKFSIEIAKSIQAEN